MYYDDDFLMGKERFEDLMERVDQQRALRNGKVPMPLATPVQTPVIEVAASDLYGKGYQVDNWSSVYNDLRRCLLSELSNVLIACGVDKKWALRHVGAMREVLSYHVRYADAAEDAWSLERVGNEICLDGYDPEYYDPVTGFLSYGDDDRLFYADELRDEMGFDELDKVCRNIAFGYEWDYEEELEPADPDFNPLWPEEPVTVVTVDDSDDDVEVDDMDDIPF